MVKGKGDTIHIPELANLTATSKSADSDVTLSNPTEDVTDISIDQHYHVAVKVEDMAAIQSQTDLNNLGSFYRKVTEKLCKLRETLFETIRSQARKFLEGSETIITLQFLLDEGIVRTAW